MLKMTKKADYGLIALRHIALSNGNAASAKEIAECYDIPLSLLAKILQTLTKSGSLQSVSGTHGGYKLSRDPRQITVLEVIRAIDGPIVLTSCFTTHGDCDQSEKCTVREPLRHVHEAIMKLLQRTTIQHLVSGPGPGCEQEPPRHPLIGENAFSLNVL